MAVSDNMQQAIDEYGSANSPYASLQDYLMNQPVYDRGPREAPNPYAMNKVTVRGPSTEDLLASQYKTIMDQQQVADDAAAAARQTEINSLRDLLKEDLSTSEAAAASERSDLTKSLEQRISDMRSGVDAETGILRQQGVDERAAMSAEQKRISDLVQKNIDQTAADLVASEERVRTAQTEAIGSLEDRQGSLIGDIEERISGLGESLNSTKEKINADLDARDAQLTGDQKTAAEAIRAEIDAVRESLGTVQEEIQTENKSQLEALKNERETLLGNIEANVESLKENIEGLPVDQIQEEIDNLREESDSLKNTSSDERKQLFDQMQALRDGMLTNDQVNSSIAEAMQSGTLTPDQINTAIESLKQDVEGKIGSLAPMQSLEMLQQEVETVAESTSALGSEMDLLQKVVEGRATREDLAKLSKSLEGNFAGIQALQKAMEGRATNEDLAILQESVSTKASEADLLALRESLGTRAGQSDLDELRAALEGSNAQIAGLSGQMLDPELIERQRVAAIQAAMDPIEAQRQAAIQAAIDPIEAQRQAAIQAAMDPIAGQRQEAISGAINPLQAQLQALQQQMPQEVDVDALRKSIMEEMKNQYGGGNVNVGQVAVESGLVNTPSGSSSSASANISDGQADRLGLFDEAAGQIAGSFEAVPQQPAPVSPAPVSSGVTANDILKMSVGIMPTDMDYDLNNDGRISSRDALLFQKNAIKQAPAPVQPLPPSVIPSVPMPTPVPTKTPGVGYVSGSRPTDYGMGNFRELNPRVGEPFASQAPPPVMPFAPPVKTPGVGYVSGSNPVDYGGGKFRELNPRSAPIRMPAVPFAPPEPELQNPALMNPVVPTAFYKKPQRLRRRF
tara:strand:- start:15221 stop:17779 length:2559 start_codon:yes stop_codon:yes gene_type:complete